MKLIVSLLVAVFLVAPVAQAGGIVKVSQSGNGTLKITGDNVRNQILIVQNGGTTDVEGEMDDAGPTRLKVGGVIVDKFGFAGVTGLSVKLKGGDDRLMVDGSVINAFSFSGSVKIDSGNDDDTVWVRDLDAVKDVKIKTGKGRDIVYFLDATVSGKSSIRAGGDDDNVLVQGVVSPTLDIKAEKGDDRVCLLSSTIANGAKVDGGRGVSWIDILHDELVGTQEQNFTSGVCWT